MAGYSVIVRMAHATLANNDVDYLNASSVGWAELVKPNISLFAMSSHRASMDVGLHEERSAQPTKVY